MAESEEKGPLVRTGDLFAGLPDAVYRDIVAKGTPREFEGGQPIFVAGNPISEVLLLTHGRAKVCRFDVDGDEVILRLIVPSEIIGGLSLDQEGVHLSTAFALEACRVVAWKTATFESTSETFPLLRRNAARILGRHLSELESRFCEISIEKVSARLARALIRLSIQIGHRANGNYEINLSQRDLAQMTAMSMWSVNRVLASWQHQGLLCRRRNAIVFRNYDSLLDLLSG